MTWAETAVRRRAARVRSGRAVWRCRAAEAGAPESGWLSQELDLALEHVERFVFVAVDVRRRPAVGRHDRLHRIAIVRPSPRDVPRIQTSETLATSCRLAVLRRRRLGVPAYWRASLLPQLADSHRACAVARGDPRVAATLSKHRLREARERAERADASPLDRVLRAAYRVVLRDGASRACAYHPPSPTSLIRLCPEGSSSAISSLPRRIPTRSCPPPTGRLPGNASAPLLAQSSSADGDSRQW
jgi:hypothetical protein